VTLSRRVAAIETALSPTQLVLRWLADAHSYGSVERYVASLLQGDPPANPLDRLAREAAHGAQAAMRGKRPEVVAEAVRSALRETVFRFELVVQINVRTHELLDREGVIEAALAAHVALLVSEKPRPAKHADRFARLRDLLGFRVRELRAAQEARAMVEERYLGHPALFPDVARAWEEQVRSTQIIDDMAVRLGEVHAVPPAVPPDPEAPPQRTVELVADLVEPAKAEALEKLGESERAFDIANDWLRRRMGVEGRIVGG
jgi:hypothetical protein